MSNSSKPQVLSEDSLHEVVTSMVLNWLHSENNEDKMIEQVKSLINEQKIAHAEYVINTETKAVYSAADTTKQAAQQIMANVKAQQRKRNV